MSKRKIKWSEDQPIYRQIVDRVVAAILDGDLPETELLPSVRQLAEKYEVSTLTAAKVFQELARDGLVDKRRGIGFLVREGTRNKLLDQERRKFLEQEWPELLKRISRLQLDVDDLLGKSNR